MSEQRLMEEVLEGMRELRAANLETSVKVAEVLQQLKNMNGMRESFDNALRRIDKNHGRIEAIEKLNLDARLRKVEGTTYKIVVGAMALIGVFEMFDKLAILLRSFRL